jgi:hypothetical protein
LRILRGGGWRTVVARAGDSVPHVWTQLVLGEGHAPGGSTSASHRGTTQGGYPTVGVTTGGAASPLAGAVPAADGSTSSRGDMVGGPAT